ncbi:MerR family transcriptional regulator [Marinithermus hydrothermalis]|uniref:HTH merR-type domain-containing protein n=1 Tax=Marinithermus hydrothermalis (strain DSM 14884 / JCM 11576 / T1) TaxID=869210 RepID=F2NP40_MARHT|nr:MerR family transcriptional regulator [Marinithermus hydrothermalis]AEB11628.1 hypothetical protein Marky_0882 [Marinithermus hydrothermalis DSM 14884]
MGTPRKVPDNLSPAQAAERLGISAAQLRKYAPIYEERFGTLPRDARGRRVYPQEAVARLEAARALIREGKAESIRAALEQLSAAQAWEGEDPVLAELRRIRELLEVHQRRLARLEEETRGLREVLKPPEDPPDSLTVARLEPWEEVRAGLWAALRGLRRAVRRRLGQE